MHQHKPQPALLRIWRIFLIVFTLVPAFLNSMLFSLFSPVWNVITGAWVVMFLFFYLLYLPVRYKNLCYGLREEKIYLEHGVFYRNIAAIPIKNIQFVMVLSNPIGRLWGLYTVRITAPGGNILLPGLSEQEARVLESLVPVQSSGEIN